MILFTVFIESLPSHVVILYIFSYIIDCTTLCYCVYYYVSQLIIFSHQSCPEKPISKLKLSITRCYKTKNGETGSKTLHNFVHEFLFRIIIIIIIIINTYCFSYRDGPEFSKLTSSTLRYIFI